MATWSGDVPAGALRHARSVLRGQASRKMQDIDEAAVEPTDEEAEAEARRCIRLWLDEQKAALAGPVEQRVVRCFYCVRDAGEAALLAFGPGAMLGWSRTDPGPREAGEIVGYVQVRPGEVLSVWRGQTPVPKKRASGPTIPEAVRAERGTAQVVSIRLAPETVRALDALRSEGESRGAAITRLVLAAKDALPAPGWRFRD